MSEPAFAPPTVQSPTQSASRREPLPISQLKPLRPPSDDFRALSEKFSWSHISKFQADRDVDDAEAAAPIELTPQLDRLEDRSAGIGYFSSPTDFVPEPASRERLAPVSLSVAPNPSQATRRQRRSRAAWKLPSLKLPSLPVPSAPVVYAASLGLGMAVALGVAVRDSWPSADRAIAPLRDEPQCVGSIRVGATLAPEAIAQLSGQVGRNRSEVVASLGEPYCALPKMAVRYGALVERDLYLAADESRVVLSYEGGALLGAGIEAPPEATLALRASLGATQPTAEQTSTEASPTPNGSAPLREVKVQQYWGVQVGDDVGAASVLGSLGDVSLAHRGQVLAPIDGWVEEDFVTIVGDRLLPNEPGCVLFSSPQLPAYLVKTCGLVQRDLGDVRAGEPIGRTSSTLHVSLLSQRGNAAAGEAEWVYVSPSPEFLALAIEGEN